METIREARLRGQAADRYPFLPVRIWTQAVRIAEMVGNHLKGAPRALVDGDFRFRGGSDHPVGAQTRTTDPEQEGG